MNKIVALVIMVATLLGLSSCAKDSELLEDVTMTGNIQGLVKDFSDGHLISNCNVTLSPDNKSFITGDDGSFNFKSLKSGEYTLTFVKAGYDDATKTVSVTASQTSDASITIKAKGAFSLSESMLNFGDLTTSLSVTICNNSDTQCTFEASNIPVWASFSAVNGTVSAQGNTVITVTVDRDKVDYGKFQQNVTLSYKAGSQGSVTISLNMEKVKQSEPIVSIAASPINVGQTSFEIGGQLLATGGMEVSAYGHCWSLKPGPTINDMISNNGSTKNVCEFKSTISNLSVSTTYYVRAYATNALGTSYSEEIVVATQNEESDKWDGSIAKSFAGGNGSYVNPFLIKTGAQLALMASSSDSHDMYYKLENNIDLDNRNWFPVKNFQGEFDGNGKIIYNLSVDSDHENLGLFETITQSAHVYELTISGVKIGNFSSDNLGALAGTNCGRIDDCKVIFSQDSYIKGMNNVGGLVGYSYGNHNDIYNCVVESSTNEFSIYGDQNVGGICGSAGGDYMDPDGSHIAQCKVSANISGSKNVGGVCGNADTDLTISESSYIGKIEAKSNSGGIAGSGAGTYIMQRCTKILNCRSNVNIISNDGYVGGIVGGGYDHGSGYSSVGYCYSTGTLSSSNHDAVIGGISGLASQVYGCYSTINCNQDTYYGISGHKDAKVEDCITISPTINPKWGSNKDCKTNAIGDDIIKFFSNPVFVSIYNTNNTWTWTGKVEEQEISVLCPRLSWE